MSGNRSKSAFFERGSATLSADFRENGASPTNHYWHQSSRVIALSCGIKISAVRHLVVSQCTRVTDRRSDRITTPKTALAYARVLKTKKTALSHPFRTLRANVRTPSMARKARSRLYVRRIIELLSLSPTVETL